VARGDEIGISFSDGEAQRASRTPATDASPTTGEEALRRRVRALEAEIARLQSRILQLTSD
jgi:uncharacterized protein YceH (UPF0502 family)